MAKQECPKRGEMKKREILIANWINGKWKINNQIFKEMIQRTQNMLDKVDLRPMADHLDIFQQVLTHVARERGATSNFFVVGQSQRIEVVRSFFDGALNVMLT